MKRNLLFLIAFCCGFVSIAQNITKSNFSGPEGIRVNTYNGNMFFQRSDLSINAQGPDLGIRFSYNSGKTKLDHGYGYGWTFNYNILYETDSNNIIIRRGDGRKDVFTFTGIGYQAPIGIFDTLVEYQSGKYRLTTKGQTNLYFDDSTHKRLTSVEDRNNNTLIIAYTDTLATSITDASGRSLSLNYTDGHLSSIVDNNASPARTITYEYATNNCLSKVTNADGNSFDYFYDKNKSIIQINNLRSINCDIIYNNEQRVSGIKMADTEIGITYDTTNNQTIFTEEVNSSSQSTTYIYDSNENLEQVGVFFRRIKDYFENVFLITHNPLVREWADNGITIVKEKNISTFNSGNERNTKYL